MKHLIIIGLVLLLTGCASGLFAGNYQETTRVNPLTGLAVVHPLTQVPIKDKKRQSKEAVGFEQLSSVVESMAQARISDNQLKMAMLASAPVVSCDTLTHDQLIQLSASGQSSYISGVTTCKMFQMFKEGYAQLAEVVHAVVNKDPIVAVSQNIGNTIAKVSAEGTRKVGLFTNPIFGGLTQVGLARAIVGGYETASNNTARVGIAAAETGNVTVSELNISSSQHGSASANGGSATSSGEAGTAIAESTSATSTNSRSGTDSVVLNIGNGNNSAAAFDSGVNQMETRSTQNLTDQANGRVNDTSKTNELSGDDNSLNDEDGLKL